MEYGVTRRSVSSESRGASVSGQDGECASALLPSFGEPLIKRMEALPGGRGGPGAALPVHERHMPKQPDKFHIPKKEKKALLKHISGESREYEGVMTILTAGHVDATSVGCFTYSSPRLVHSEQLEREFVEKRREMKAEGRTDKELEESYCFLLTEEGKVQWLCEKGLIVGQNWQSALGDPNKGVYLCRYSDLIQVHPFHHGASGEIIVFKVMKGKVKSIYENIKNVLDPTPRFDSHLSKNFSKVTSVNSYRAFEHTQHYFYEYDFDELKERPRQVCPYAVVSYHYKGKDAPLPSMPLAPVRTNSWPGEARKEPAHFTVWSGDLVHDDKILFPISLRSSWLPFLPHKIPDRLKLGRLMRLDKVTKLLPPELFFYNLYDSSKEVVTQGHHCSLLEVVDRCRSMNSISRLLQELEDKNVVLVSALTERGFLFLLSSAQMATPPERGESWKRRLQALFVFPESRDVDKSASSCASSGGGFGNSPISGLKHFIPALHHALIRSHANPSSELSTGVELQAQEYLVGQKDGKVRTYEMPEYDAKAGETATAYPASKRHRLNMDGFLRMYLHNPARYQLAVSHATKMVELHCTRLEPPAVKPRKGREGAGSNANKLLELTDLVMTCKRKAENEVKREEVREDTKTPASERRMEQRAAQLALKYLKSLYQPSQLDKSAGGQAPALPGSLAFLIQSVGLMGVDVQDDGSELAGKLRKLLTGLKQTARNAPLRIHSGKSSAEGQAELSPFDRLAAKMGLPANRDIDLRKQDDLEEQMTGSVSSLEGFSLSGESYLRGGVGSVGRRAYDEDIPWRLIPITGLSSEKYTQRERNLPQDPRLHFVMAPAADQPPSLRSVTSPKASPPPSPSPSPAPALSPEPSPPASPARCPSPELSPAPCSEPRRQAPLEARRPPSPTGYLSPPSAAPHSQSSPSQEQRNHVDRQQQVAPHSSVECAADALREPSCEPFAPSSMTAERVAEGGDHPDSSAFALASTAPSSLQQRREMEEEVMEVVDLTVSSEEEECAVLSVSLPPPNPLRGIDDILDKHLGHFSADLHHLLQEESINCRFPEARPHYAPEPLSAAPPVVMPFSQYVSLYHPCPPVQGYVSSLQDGISTMLRDYDDPRLRNELELVLANSVSAFVSSIRAGTDEPGSENAASQLTATGGQLSDPPPHSAPRPVSVGPRANHETSPAQSTQPNSISASSVPTEAPESGSESGSDPLTIPPAETLSSVIRQLKPEVLSNLYDIIKDVQKSPMVQFYVHAFQLDDQLVRNVKEYLTQQGLTEQDPVSFLKQEVSDRKLLVIIKNKDIAEHIHEIPGLVSLKQHQSVIFLGIDTVDDFKTPGYKQLFVCGGCILSEDLVLNPDLVTPEQLEGLMELLEQRNSPENVWRWKIHSKPLKKLKEQARFRRDAAGLLDVILKHHQQKIVEVLPQHHCDNSKQPSPDLHCLIQHQAHNTRFRHTVFLRVHILDFMRFSKSGIITAAVDEMLNNFDALLGHRDDSNKQSIVKDLHTAKGVAGKLSGEDNMNGGTVEQQSPQTVPSLAYASEQQNPQTTLGENDAHILHMAITHLRAQRNQQQASDTENKVSSAGATVPPANENTLVDSTNDRREEVEPSSSKKEADSISSPIACPLEGEASRCTKSNKNQSPKRDVDLRPHQSPSRAPSNFVQQHQRWRGASHYQNHQYQNHQYQNHRYPNQQHPQHYNFYSDPSRNPVWGFPRQQVGQRFAGGYDGYWNWPRGGERGRFNGM
ncbi:protein TASOR-like isoform X1 [Hippocampus zosterae]|uniref:protein TASOR-like isoform X1 n=1 Tax=Hippocampus zosterae TaxID=109293 RepID=UPI00223D7EA4|nr:protein TASOR-like isoform X1 [Hippocampus zosterae]